MMDHKTYLSQLRWLKVSISKQYISGGADRRLNILIRKVHYYKYTICCNVKSNFKVARYTSTLYLFVETNRVIVPDEIHESYPGKNIYRKDPKFSDRSSGQTV